ncbi:F0F1 ATP synthase subunit gamma [Patescibacteria group bacterium]|nr:F0F1 ATP synthase subunit gamma [Patescibacteria group bacterium]
MPTIEEIRKDLSEVEMLKLMSQALLEVSALRIKSFKSEFESNRSFFDEMSDLYNLVKISAGKLDVVIPETKKDNKPIFIAITSNHRFYGRLNIDVVNVLLSEFNKNKGARILVIGATGKRYLEEAEQLERQPEFLVFKEDYPTPKETQMFLEKTKLFGRVFVCYPKFINLFVQKAVIVDITHTPEVESETKDKQVYHIFEPELESIAHFFETQVRKVLFVRIMLEAELSRIAARIAKMHSTEERSVEAIRQKRQELRREIFDLEDIRLLETFAGSKRWRK